MFTKSSDVVLVFVHLCFSSGRIKQYLLWHGTAWGLRTGVHHFSLSFRSVLYRIACMAEQENNIHIEAIISHQNNKWNNNFRNSVIQ